MDSLVPSCTFQEHTEAENSILRLCLDICGLDLVVDLKFEAELINSEDILSGIILLGSGKEGLGEEQSGQPECSWHSISNPFVYEVNTIIYVLDPRTKWLQGQQSTLVEGIWNLVVE